LEGLKNKKVNFKNKSIYLDTELTSEMKQIIMNDPNLIGKKYKSPNSVSINHMGYLI